MIEFTRALIFYLESLKFYEDCCGEQSCAQYKSPVEDRDKLRGLNSMLIGMTPLLKFLRLNKTQERVGTLQLRLRGLGVLPDRSPHALKTELSSLSLCLQAETASIKAKFIDPDVAEFFEHESLFGKRVNRAFPSAKPHIKDAGNCLATDLHTAAVFHFMIAAEYGLRSLAKRFRVKTRRPLEFSDWGSVISAVKYKLSNTSPRSKKGNTTVVFYREMIEKCDYLKDVWRNNIFHARRRCDEHDSHKALEKSRDFLQRLEAKGFREII
jgi:hypothetical protein